MSIDRQRAGDYIQSDFQTEAALSAGLDIRYTLYVCTCSTIHYIR